jgi:hypothetical protein
MTITSASIALVAAVPFSKQDAGPSSSDVGTSSTRDPVPREPALASLKSRLGATLAELGYLPPAALLLTLATGCGSVATEPSPPIARDVTIRASWHLLEAGYMTDATLLSPASDVLQATAVDAQGTAALRRALAKCLHPTLQVPPEPDLHAERITWRIPVGRSQTVVTMAVRHVDETVDVDLLCDGERVRRRVLPAHCLLVHGFPTNAALLCPFEFDHAP